MSHLALRLPRGLLQSDNLGHQAAPGSVLLRLIRGRRGLRHRRCLERVARCDCRLPRRWHSPPPRAADRRHCARNDSSAPEAKAIVSRRCELRERGVRFDRYLRGVSVRICVFLTAIPGREVLLAQYEDRVLGLLPDHGARIDTRVRALEGPLTEVQILEFPSEQALVDFQNDPRRTDLSEIRNAVIASTTVIRVESTTTA
jgi:uncharacterized protein (DUF1330 family)